MTGYHALYTLSFTQKKSRSQLTCAEPMPGSKPISSSLAIRSRMPPGSVSFGSASIPIPAISPRRATAAAQYPSQCVMLPTIPAGQSGSLPIPRKTGRTGAPSNSRARWAQLRPAANSARRAGNARSRFCASSAQSDPEKGPKSSAVATSCGRIREIIVASFRLSSSMAAPQPDTDDQFEKPMM